jgi:hypothetical protein
MKRSELTPENLKHLDSYFCQIVDCEGLIEPLPSGTFIVSGFCPECKSWYGHEYSDKHKGFYLNGKEDMYSLEWKNRQRIQMGMEPIEI